MLDQLREEMEAQALGYLRAMERVKYHAENDYARKKSKTWDQSNKKRTIERIEEVAHDARKD